MNRDIDDSSENVLSDWPREGGEPELEDEAAAWGTATTAEPTEVEEDEVLAVPQPDVEEPGGDANSRASSGPMIALIDR